MTAHEVRLRVARAAPGAPSRSTRTTASPRRSTCPTRRRVDDVARAYRLAWELGCLGITVFRDGCKEEQVLHVGTKTGRADRRGEPRRPAAGGRQAAPAEPHGLDLPDRDAARHGATSRSTSTATGEPFEVFVSGGQGRVRHDGGGRGAGAADLARPSHALPALGASVGSRKSVSAALADRRRRPHGVRAAAKMLSLPDALARTWPSTSGQAKVEETEQPAARRSEARRVGDICTECGQATFVYEEGCKKCLLVRLQRVLSASVPMRAHRSSAP